jgi:hydroxypyruvate isomerase
MQMMGEDIIRTIRDNFSLIGYYHLAKVPGRNEPVGGEINFAAFLQAVAETGYEGYIGLEYRPSGDYSSAFEQIRNAYPSYV